MATKTGKSKVAPQPKPGAKPAMPPLSVNHSGVDRRRRDFGKRRPTGTKY